MKTAYPQTDYPVKIYLYSNIPFDNTYKNHCLVSKKFTYNNTAISTIIDPEIAKKTFLERKDFSQVGNPRCYPYYVLDGEFNFNFTNGLVGSVTLELTAEQTNANYMRIRCGSSNLNYEYYYYFITGISQVNSDTYTLSLELDVLMTYQDEFLDGMKGVPVFADRKHSHRYTSDGLRPYCADLKTGDDVFSNVKPSRILNVYKTQYNNQQLQKIEGIYWLYICVDIKLNGTIGSYNTYNFLYRCKDKYYPVVMMAIPLLPSSITGVGDISAGLQYAYFSGGATTNPVTKTREQLRNIIAKLINDGSIHGVKISPYPPFNTCTITRDSDNSRLCFTGDSGSQSVNTSNYVINSMVCGNNTLLYGRVLNIDSPSTFEYLLANGGVIITNQQDFDYEMKELTFPTSNGSAPTIISTRYQDPKLIFEPFRKYIINAQYSSQGCEIYPELMYCRVPTSATNKLSLVSITSSYIGDNNIYTYPYVKNVSALNNYTYEKIGLASTINYVFPCGSNALDVFNSTQAQSFYTSKVASGITSGLTVGGGVASMVVGGALMSNPATMMSGAAMMIGGATAVASGTSSFAMNIKSANAKIEDLKNTPDSINISGSNFVFDDALLGDDTKGLPYLVLYDCEPVIKERANDYFYTYGYQVARDCYFNTELKVDLTALNYVDNNLFGRTIFNYIKLNDDITNKINANIPLIVKQKLNSIFNAGITLWNFFGFKSLWVSTTTTPTSQYYIDNWFMKHDLDNTEYDGTIYNNG